MPCASPHAWHQSRFEYLRYELTGWMKLIMPRGGACPGLRRRSCRGSSTADLRTAVRPSYIRILFSEKISAQLLQVCLAVHLRWPAYVRRPGEIDQRRSTVLAIRRVARDHGKPHDRRVLRPFPLMQHLSRRSSRVFAPGLSADREVRQHRGGPGGHAPTGVRPRTGNDRAPRPSYFVLPEAFRKLVRSPISVPSKVGQATPNCWARAHMPGP